MNRSRIPPSWTVQPTSCSGICSKLTDGWLQIIRYSSQFCRRFSVVQLCAAECLRQNSNAKVKQTLFGFVHTTVLLRRVTGYRQNFLRSIANEVGLNDTCKSDSVVVHGRKQNERYKVSENNRSPFTGTAESHERNDWEGMKSSVFTILQKTLGTVSGADSI